MLIMWNELRAGGGVQDASVLNPIHINTTGKSEYVSENALWYDPDLLAKPIDFLLSMYTLKHTKALRGSLPACLPA